MSSPDSKTFSLIAMAFCYPIPGRLEILENEINSLRANSAKRFLETFTKQIKSISLHDWEELFTRTIDLAPLVAPYVGYQIWGDAYQRGEFMADLNHAYGELELDTEGELPDHLVPILRYLEISKNPLPQLLENIKPATEAMHKTLKTLDGKNPYLNLFKATLEAAEQISLQLDRRS